jgi:NADH-quinone oxidoreductase subunit G
MSDIEIEIDGKKCQAKPNAMVIQVADEAGIYIPRFCYHKHLSIAANCRMCLVEVEKAPKPLPACATPVMPGMKVFTRSSKALAAQKAVMEFLLINHPLDCPICDQGGECELQDLSMGYGSSHSFYTEGKRSVKDEDLGPLIATEMTRCILCTRCVRFGDEIAGLRELGLTFRGEDVEVSTYIQQAIKSDVSGNVIELCPVGALTSKPFRFTARAWELNQLPSIAAHDCLGSNVNVHTRTGSVMRIVPRENDQINQTWLSDRDRFSYQGLNHPDRLEKPLIRVDGNLKETDWQTAFDFAVGKLQQLMSAEGVGQVGALASPNSTTEEFYLLQKIMRSLGSNHIDHRLRQVDFSDQQEWNLFPGFTESLVELDNADAILLVGSNIQKEQPLASLRVRQAALKGAAIVSVNMMDYRFHFKVAQKEIVNPQEFPLALARIAKALGANTGELKNVTADASAKAIAKQLQEKKNSKILVGALAMNHPRAAAIRELIKIIATQTHAKIAFMTEGANAAGAWIAGAVPHRGPFGASIEKSGLNAQAMLCEVLKAYVLLNVEPEDCANPVMFTHALQQAELVIALSTFKNSTLEKLAHVIFPVGPFTETSGSFLNVSGTWQSFAGSASAFGESRPAWKVLRVFGNWLQLPGFDYQSSEEVRDELKAFEKLANRSDEGRAANSYFRANENTESLEEGMLYRIGEIPIYSGDNILRRAPALQATQTMVEGELVAVRLHPKTAKALALSEGDKAVIVQREIRLHLSVVLDERVPLQSAYIPGGLSAMNGLNELFGVVHIKAADSPL